MFLEGQFM